MAVCVSPIKSETLRGMRREGPAHLPDGVQSWFVLHFEKHAPKESSSLKAQRGTKYFTKQVLCTGHQVRCVSSTFPNFPDLGFLTVPDCYASSLLFMQPKVTECPL